jgi:hypothetical protein
MLKRVETITDRITLTVYHNGYFVSLDHIAVNMDTITEKFGYEYTTELKLKVRNLLPDDMKGLVNVEI